MTKIKISEEILEMLMIVRKLELLRGQIQYNTPIDLEQLASRIGCKPELLLEVAENLGIEIIEYYIK